jgi:hypothetical protein
LVMFLRFDEHIEKKGSDLIFTLLPLIRKNKGCCVWCEEYMVYSSSEI